jgi:outer membrane protein TolC
MRKEAMQRFKQVFSRKRMVIGTLALATFATRPALALQPLPEFVVSSQKHNFDTREARAVKDQREAEAQANTRKLLPTLSARGVYTFNQYEAVVQDKTIIPRHQLDAFINLDVPIIDFAVWARMGSGNAASEAAEAKLNSSHLDVEQSVTRSYYQVLAGRSVVASAKQALETSLSNLKILETRKAAGSVIELDYQRALAESERAKQLLANAEYLSGQQERALYTLSGLKPSPEGTALPVDDLHNEPPLAEFLKKDGEETPASRAARLEAKALDRAASATWYTLLPTLSGTAQQRFTNATGFQDRSAIFSFGASLNWRLDASVLSQAKAQEAQRDLGQVRKDRVERNQSDALSDAWALVNMQITSTKAARSESQASKLAEKIATDRYMAGISLQVDVLQASRQSFQSEAVRIQAEADLAVARANLRLIATKAVKEDAK